jgi:hypothetical protein
MSLGTSFNFFTLVPLMLVLVISISFYLHHFVWNVIQRPVYAMQRFNILKYKKTMFMIGVIFIIYSIKPELINVRTWLGLLGIKI